jgi:protease-4
MSMQADLIADRRKMRQRLSLWRVLGVLGAIIGVVGLGYAFAGRQTQLLGGQHVARVKIEGFISGDDRTLRLIREVRQAANARAVLVEIDSPGGTVSGAEAVYIALRALAQEKPTVAVVRGLAASGGYIAAAATDHVVAQQTSLVGSIGVLFQMPNVARLLDTVGVSVETLRSTPLKAAPSGFEPTSPEARAALQQVLDDHYGWFKDLVRERRKLTPAETTAAADGRVHTGRQALERRLIDAVGGRVEAIAWLENQRNVPKGLPIRDWRRRSEADALGLWTASARIARAAGLEGLATLLQRAAETDISARLDGPLALWQPVFEK